MMQIKQRWRRLVRFVHGAFVGVALLAACGAPPSTAARDWPPGVGAPRARRSPLRLLTNHGFSIGYDRAQHDAAWVAYRVKAIHGFDHLKRPSFQPDPRLTTNAKAGGEPPIYASPRYDRGHLAPNYAISQLYGKAAQRQTFYYSNIEPQRPRLNQLVWQRLEETEIDDIAPRVGTLWVIVGPIPGAFGRPPPAFYRIWLARDKAGRWQALAFRVPQWVRGDERLDRFIVSIDAIEAATGLDFFTGLADPVEDALEARPAAAATFGFEEYACKPARYGGRWRDRGGIYLHYDRCNGPSG